MRWGSERRPKSLGVRTIPAPKCSSHTRFTITRAVSGLSFDAIARANSSRPLPCVNGLRSGPDSTLKKFRRHHFAVRVSGIAAQEDVLRMRRRGVGKARSPEAERRDSSPPAHRPTSAASADPPAAFGQALRSKRAATVRSLASPFAARAFRCSSMNCSTAACRFECSWHMPQPPGFRPAPQDRRVFILRAIVEDRVERVVVGRWNRIELVIVAARAADGQGHRAAADDVDPIVDDVRLHALRNRRPSVRNPIAASERSSARLQADRRRSVESETGRRADPR